MKAMKHPSNFKYATMASDLKDVFQGEGGRVFTGTIDDKPCLIIDEGIMESAISVIEFESLAQRSLHIKRQLREG
jgi:hypothetical protein